MVYNSAERGLSV